jgi:hypothetical protein
MTDNTDHDPAAAVPAEPRPTWAADTHRMLLRLAGSLPDSSLTRARTLLADGECRALAVELTADLLWQAIPLSEADEDCLAELLEANGLDSSPLDALPTASEWAPPLYDFTAAFPSESGDHTARDALDRTAEDIARTPGVRGLWRSWRNPIIGDSPPCRVFVAETDEEADPVLLTGRLQRGLAAAGEAEPQVEVYTTGERLPPYQELARSRGTLLWSLAAGPFLMAPVFDEDGSMARFDDLDEAGKVAAYLRAGELLLSTPERLVDALAPVRGMVVPANIRTDGTWVWADAVTYYLEEYGLEPVPGLLAHIRSAHYTSPAVDGATRHRAIVFLTEPNSPGDRPQSP